MQGLQNLQAVLLLLAAVALTGTASQSGPTGPSEPPAVSPLAAGTAIDSTDVSGGTEGDARLVGRVDVNGFATGTLQVFCDGAWGLVCSSNFDDVDALVACRQLGFTTGTVLNLPPGPRYESPPEEVLAPIVLENLGCSGDEASLLQCQLDSSEASTDYTYRFRTGGPAACDFVTSNIAQVMCGMADAAGEGEVRLAPALRVASEDGSAEYGRLEIFHRGGWGTVCGRPTLERFSSAPERTTFSKDAAAVACRQLGFQQGFQIQPLEDPDEDKTALVPIVLFGPQCAADGLEQALSECPGFSLQSDLRVLNSDGDLQCRHNVDVHLVCTNGSDPELEGRVRLQDGASGPGYRYGRLEVFLRGFWSNVCNNDRFPPASAQVACKELGLDGGTTLRFVRPAERTDSRDEDQVFFKNAPVALAGVGCDGGETSITECPSNDDLIPLCSGRASFSSTVLGCADTAGGCDVVDGTTEGTVRLRGGFGTPCDALHTGFIEVLHDGEWGSICSHGIDVDRGANTLVPDVVCRQLGFPYGAQVDARPAAYMQSQAGDETPGPGSENPLAGQEDPTQRVWLISSGIACTGPEGSLLDCDLGQGFREVVDPRCPRNLESGLFVACRQFPVAEVLEGVTTPGAEEGDVRLLNETTVSNWVIGQLQVFLDGSWGQVCAGFFDAADANVACRQLGFGAGTAAGVLMTSMDFDALAQQAAFPDVALTAPGCNGSEARLVDCVPQEDAASISRRRGVECRGGDNIGLIIGCVSKADAGTEGAIRLTRTTPGGSPGAESGVLEVFHAGAWGTICNARDSNVFSLRSAQVACRSLGFRSGFVRNEVMTATVLPTWLFGISCNGSELDLADCNLPAFGDTDGCEETQRLYCFAASDRALTGQARLVSGSAAPGGEWEYGRLEVLVNGFWSTLSEGLGVEAFGRRSAEVACRSLGFEAGAQLLSGRTSPFPRAADFFGPVLLKRILCNGTEGSLGVCNLDIELVNTQFPRFGVPHQLQPSAVSLICSNPSGCAAEEGEPVEGDVRLVAINGTTSETAPCDAVHHGAVELFRDGRWGRICTGTLGDASAAFTVDAQVVCRQLGFPFGSLMDEGEANELDDDYDYGVYAYVGIDDTGRPFEDDPPLTWATQVVCTGKEERLLDCVFPENFGLGDAFREPVPGGGLPQPPCGLDGNNRFAVVCRRFEITDSEFIRR